MRELLETNANEVPKNIKAAAKKTAKTKAFLACSIANLSFFLNAAVNHQPTKGI